MAYMRERCVVIDPANGNAPVRTFARLGDARKYIEGTGLILCYSANQIEKYEKQRSATDELGHA